MTTIGELFFFNEVKDKCDIIFDIGCREDTYFIELYPQGTFHLFEPNPSFFNVLTLKLNELNSNVFASNFGLGNKTEKIKYYPDSQSFIQRTVDFQSDVLKGIDLEIVSFEEYVVKNKIDHIDFLKIDTEGNEPDILFSNAEYIKNNVKYVQFEYASTWLDRNDSYRLSDVYDLFKDSFYFFIIYNEDHPIFSKNKSMIIQFSEKSQIDIIDKYMKNSYGFEIGMEKKN